MRNFNLLILRSMWRACFVAALAVTSAPLLLAKSGDIDPTFGVAGKVVLAIATSIEHQSASVLLPDGKVLVGGICRPSASAGSETTCIAKFHSDGQVDVSFGSTGVFRSDSGACSGGGALAVASTGEIYYGGIFPFTNVDGSLRYKICVARLSATGQVDTSFATGGTASQYVEGTLAVRNAPLTMHRLPAGELIVTATCTLSAPRSFERKFCVAKFLPNGAVDTTFGSGGSTLVFGTTLGDDLITSTLAGEFIYMTGICTNSSPASESICVSKINSTGASVASWSASGRFLATLSGVLSSQGSELTIAADGSALIAGACSSASARRGCVVSLDNSGLLDSTFGQNGLLLDWSTQVTSGFGSVSGSANGLEIMLAGRCGDSLNANSPCAWKVSANGSPDTAFGNGGVVQVPFPGSTKSFARFGLQQFANGKSLLSMSCVSANGDEDFCLARLLGRAGFFDLDSDNQTNAGSDGLLYLRHLIGYRDTALTGGALGTYADRTIGADITTYLSTPNATYPNCSASIVGAPDGPNAMLDGIVLMRAMLGLTGNAVTNGVNFPAGTARTAWADIKTHLNTNCGMVLN